MDENTKASVLQMCDNCKKLVGGSRYTLKHKDLIQTDYKPFPSKYGVVDEYYYKCQQCSKEWLHETGNYGQGWVN